MLHNLQKPTKPIRTAQLWAKRSSHVRSYLANLSLKKSQHLDAQVLIKVFFIRKSLRLKLTDTYLAKLWQMSLRNVQNRLQQLEEVGLIKRMTNPRAERVGDRWRQERKLVLLIKPNSTSSLASKKCQLSNLQAKPVDKKLTLQVKTSAKMPYVDYLALQDKVSKGSWAFWLRNNRANPRTMGYLLTNIHQRIRNRPDVLESILFDGEAAKLKDSQLVGYVVSEIKTRIAA